MLAAVVKVDRRHRRGPVFRKLREVDAVVEVDARRQGGPVLWQRHEAPAIAEVDRSYEGGPVIWQGCKAYAVAEIDNPYRGRPVLWHHLELIATAAVHSGDTWGELIGGELCPLPTQLEDDLRLLFPPRTLLLRLMPRRIFSFTGTGFGLRARIPNRATPRPGVHFDAAGFTRARRLGVTLTRNDASGYVGHLDILYAARGCERESRLFRSCSV